MGRVQTRYEISHEVEGLIDTEATLSKAQKHATRWGESHTGYPNALDNVRIYDSMARRGQITMWRFNAGSWHGVGLRVY